MLDDFRQQAADSFADDIEEFQPPPVAKPFKFLGLTPPQMFIVSLLLMVLACLLSAFCLLATGRVVPTGMSGAWLLAVGL
jgi:hypothetical protein